MSSLIDVCPGAATLDAHFTVDGIDLDTTHTRKVNHQAVVAGAQTSPIMTSTTYCDQEVLFPAEIDRRDDIGRIGTACNNGRALVDHPVIYFAGLVVVIISRPDDFTAHAGGELFGRSLNTMVDGVCL